MTQKGYYLFIGCLHFPYHNKPFYEQFVKLQKELNPLRTYLLGDVIDLSSLSSHSIGQEKWTDYEEETRLTNEWLDQLEGPTTYIYGNHEQRVKKMKAGNEVSKYGLPELKDKLKLNDRRWEVLEDYQTSRVTLGNFSLLHGIWGGKLPARKHLTELNNSCIFVHTHRVDFHANNKYEAYNIGWGGDSTHRAFSFTNIDTKSYWRNGFAVGYLDSKENLHVRQILWKGDSFFFDGKLYPTT